MHNIKQSDYGKYADNRDVISLFSGAMGLDIGLGKAGLNVVIGQDFDSSCVKTMRAFPYPKIPSRVSSPNKVIIITIIRSPIRLM